MLQSSVKVGTLSQLRESGPIKAKVADKRVLVFLAENEPVATQARCPHAHGPLHEGEICGTVLTCPWHGWSFDLKSGECEEDPDLLLERFSVTVEGDDIFVSI
tara:strand:- start:178 stop:486 length:309 start_codon:yes stop_codon:yes gene_type:complete